MKRSLNDKTLFMLINHLSRRFHHNMRTECDKIGISRTYQPILFHLDHNDGLSQLDIAHLTNLTPPTVSVTLQKMESDGLIIRKNDTKDVRRMCIFITEKGRETNNTIKKAAQNVEKELTKNISEKDIETMRKYLIMLSSEE